MTNRILFLVTTLFFFNLFLYGQGIGVNETGASPDDSAMLDVSSSTKGILIPRMTKSQCDALTSPATGLMVYITDQIPGFYFFDGSSWKATGAGAIAIDDLTDAASDGSSLFIGHDSGSSDDGSNTNLGIGINALYSVTSGTNNTAFGYEALNNNSIGNYNIALGFQAGYFETGSHKLYIENSNSSSPLIGGDFSLDEVYLNAHVGIGTSTPSDNLEVVEDGGTAAILATSYRPTGFGAGQFIGRAARGSFASPSALQVNDVIASFNARGYGDTGFSNLPRGRMAFIAAENWTDASQGTYFTLNTTPLGTSSSSECLRITSEGHLGVGTSDPLTTIQTDGDFTFAAAGESTDESRYLGQMIASQGTFDPNQGFGGIEIENLDKDDTDDSAQKLHFWTHNQGVDANRRMTIDIDGKVGIGTETPNHKLDLIHNSDSEQSLMVTQEGNANAATFKILGSSSTGHALNVYNNGSGYGLDLVIQSDGTGPGGRFSIDNGNNNQPAIYAEHNGLGNAGQFKVINSSNSMASVYALTNGLGNAGRYQINNTSSGAVALYAVTNGTGAALGGNNSGSSGTAGFFNITSASNTDNALEVKTQGLGSTALFEVQNVSNSDPVVLITGNGSGPSLAANGLLSMAGFHLSVSPVAGHVLTSDATGLGTWQAPAFDFADGGDAGGADRTIGNTDNYSLGLMTNNQTRVHISNSGLIGIGGTNNNLKTYISHDRYHLGLTESDAGTEQKNWCMQADNGQFKIQAVMDNWGGWNTVFFLSRNGINVDRSGYLGETFGFGDPYPDAEVEISGNGGTDELFMVSSDDDNDGDVLIIDNTGKIGVNNQNPTALLDLIGATGYNQLRMRTSYTPTGSTDSNGNVGDISWDDNYIYVKTSFGWKRSALTSW